MMVLQQGHMGLTHGGVPNTWFEEDIKLDIIDDGVFGINDGSDYG
jgi:hypothetical protein